MSKNNCTEMRPWGCFTVLLDTDTHKVKELIVHPEQRLSYQYHYQRDEHWYVVEGEVTVIIDDEEKILSPGDSIDIFRNQKHRICNKSTENIKIIEIQTGEYFGEDDIVRIDDDYNRV